MVSTARFPSLMFILTRPGSTEAMDGWVRAFYGNPRALTLENLAGIVADFDTLLTGPLDAAMKASVQRLRDGFANTVSLSPPPQPVPANNTPQMPDAAPRDLDDQLSPASARRCEVGEAAQPANFRCVLRF